MDAGVRISLRLDLSAYELFDDGEGARRAGAAVVQVHSLADPTLVVDAAALWAGAADATFGPRARVDAALAVRRAARVWPPLDRLSEQDVPDVLALSEEELSDLLGVAATRLGAAGVAVHWPRDLAQDLSAAAVVRPAPGSATDGTGFFESEELLQFRWQLALGGDPLTEAEMDTLAEAHRPVVRLRDQWVLVDPALVRKARKRELGLLDPVDALSVALTGTAEVDGETVEAVPVGALAALRDRLTAGRDPVEPPPGLQATPPRLPTPGPGLAGPHDLARPRRLPRRRHGPRQDRHPHRAAPAPGPQRADPGRLPGLAARQLAAGDHPFRPRRPRPPLPRPRPHPGRTSTAASSSPPTARCGRPRRSSPSSPGAWSSRTRPSTSRTPTRRRRRRCGRSRPPRAWR